MEGNLTEQFNPVQGSPELLIDAPGWELWLGAVPGLWLLSILTPALCGGAEDVPTVRGTCPQE